MIEEWDIYPCVPLPYRMHLGFRNLSAEELAAEEEKIDKEHKKHHDEVIRQWREQKSVMVKKRIKFLRWCRRNPGTERPHCGGYVYLLWCPSLEAYKIGETKNLKTRFNKHRQKLDAHLEERLIYRTPASIRRLLEKILLRHFAHCRFTSDKSNSKELFKLSNMEVNGFGATIAIVERHVLAIEIVRLKGRLSEIEAELQSP